jgi:hypothetical protein
MASYFNYILLGIFVGPLEDVKARKQPSRALYEVKIKYFIN